LGIANFDFTLLGKEEWCCGNPFFSMGMREEAKRFAMHNVEKIKEKGVKTLLTSCAGCYRVISQEYPKILGKELPFKVVHITQFLDKLINEGSFKLKSSSYNKVTYHDPCEIGRYAEIYEEPRNIIHSIPNLELVEMAKNRENSLVLWRWRECQHRAYSFGVVCG
jgi:heterodisulfide reductase subunit D